jgi:hypothetical protein
MFLEMVTENSGLGSFSQSEAWRIYHAVDSANSPVHASKRFYNPTVDLSRYEQTACITLLHP